MPDLSCAVPFEQMGSANPHRSVDTAARVDPYFHGLFGGGAQASWLSRATAEQRQADGVGRLRLKDARITPEVAVRSLLSGPRRDRSLAALGALGSWRTMTGEQIAAITGHPELAASQLGMRAAWAAGLVERGSFLSQDMIGRSAHTRLTNLYRPLAGRDFDAFAHRLRYAEWVQMTAGLPWRVGTQRDRHNLLATELGLRIASHCEIGAVFGEALSNVEVLTGSGVGGNAAADLTAVRVDGLRIAVEITATIGVGFEKKCQRWAEAIYRSDPAGVCAVIFVEASDPARQRATMSKASTFMRAAIADAAYRLPGYANAGVPQRMAAVSWRDWFPASGVASRGFTGLEVLRPVGVRGERWHRADMLDVIEVPADVPASAAAILENSRHLLGMPHWLRDQGTPDFTDLLLQRAGVSDVVTAVPYAPSRRVAGRTR